jgi:DNA replication and repair protein RecF
VHLVSLVLTDFRNIASGAIEPDPVGTTVITGLNGTGKTSVLEAVAYLSTLQSFRGASRETMVRSGADRAVLRGETRVGERAVTIECELSAAGPSRALVNRQTVRRRDQLHEALRTTVFSPDEIGVVREGPGERRRFLDETLAVIDPRSARACEEVEKILRQRNALLRGGRKRLDSETARTLDVWDARLGSTGTLVADARESLAAALSPVATEHYARLAGEKHDVTLVYQRTWSGPLAEALERSRAKDLERGLTLVGPHRDDLEISLDDLPARSHASQGEQRSLALALRLAAHQLATERLGEPPVLLLDDVFSELDRRRSEALLAGLPEGQTLLTTAVPLPPGVRATRSYHMTSPGELTLGDGADPAGSWWG